MEDQAPYKVFNYWNGEATTPEVRRFGIDRGVVSSFQYLNAKLQDVYPGLKTKTYTITWKDEEGDDVVISSDEELMTMLMSLSGDFVKLFIRCKVDEVKDDDCDMANAAMPVNAGSTPLNLPHFGVTCDGCNEMVIGFRYKCTVCDDFDLCSRCETACMHPDHCMVRIPTPNLPQFIIKAAIKRSRMFLKSVAKDKCNERKHRRDHHGHHQEGDHNGRRHHSSGVHSRAFGTECNMGMPPNPQYPNEYPRCERGSKRPRGSWYESFVSYMNEFANLAGDIMTDVEKNASERKPEQTTETASGDNTQAPQNQQSNGETAQAPQNPQSEGDNAQTAQNQQSSTDNAQSAQNPQSGGDNAQTAQNLQSGGDDAQTVQVPQNPPASENTPPPQNPQPNSTYKPQEVRPPFMPEHLTMEEAHKMMQFAVQTQGMLPFPFNLLNGIDANAVNKDAVQGDPKVAETDAVNTQAPTASGNILHETSPDKADDWTVINSERDLMDTAGNASAPSDPTDVIGFNLPEEFKKRVTFADSGLYPPLNTATAVMNPKAPEATVPQRPLQAAANAAATQRQASAPPRPGPAQQKPQIPAQPQLRQRHPKPHIDAAIQHMLAMGFTNDGGWLTQLLESKDGNIAAVLDLLTPVNPKK